ncbi:hypothetical protein GCM10010052_20000 [Paenarthrobacter histidinolovorans]|nr:hypothetical protein GCM10010052_20000 [Paenarthrobacter histidinolovorans]
MFEGVQWPHGRVPGKCGARFAPLFYRDSRLLTEADIFRPELWLDQSPDHAKEWALVSFSEGPVRFSGRQLVLVLAGALLAQLVEQTEFLLSEPGSLQADDHLPGT